MSNSSFSLIIYIIVELKNSIQPICFAIVYYLLYDKRSSCEMSNFDFMNQQNLIVEEYRETD